jgi:hypothetical protein
MPLRCRWVFRSRMVRDDLLRSDPDDVLALGVSPLELVVVVAVLSA